MLKHASRRATCAVLITLAGLPSAVSAWGGTGWYTVTEMTLYMASVKNGAMVKVSPAVPNLEGCSHAAGDYVFFDFAAPGPPNGRDLYATILAAHMAGREVNIGTNGCTSDGFPIAYGVSVREL